MHITARFFMIVLIALPLVQISCDKDGDNPVPQNEAFAGSFVSAVHETSGTASVSQDLNTLTLTNFETDSGPDLNIYLTRDLNDVDGDFHDLGDIQGIDGTYSYSLPSGISYTEYRYVVVWCVAFSVNFGYAELIEQ